MGTLRKILKFLGVFVILACANFGVAHAEFSIYVTINDNGATTASEYSGLYYNADDTICETDRYYDGISCKFPMVTEFTAPTKTGFKYLGHYTLQTGGRLWAEPIANGKTRIVQGYGPNNNPTVYAHWRPIKITLNHQNATTNGAPDTLYLKAGTGGGWYRDEAMSQPITSLDTVPTRNGYMFVGYYTSAGGGGTQIISSTGSLLTNSNVLNAFTDDSTIYAFWVQNYTITLNPNGGTPTSNQSIWARGVNFYSDSQGNNRITASVFSPISSGGAGLSTLTYTGHTFAGYYSAASGGTQMIDSSGNIVTTNSITSSQTWYARWTQNATPTPTWVTVTIDDNGATSPSNYTQLYRNINTAVSNCDGYKATQSCTAPTVTSITPPQKTNYVYYGHYFNGTDQWANASGTIVYDVTSNTTVVAQWVGECREISFNDNNANNTNVNSGNEQHKRVGETPWYDSACGKTLQSAPIISVPTNANAEFLGYFTSPDNDDDTGQIFERYNASTAIPTSYGTNTWTISDNTILYAHWKCATNYTWNAETHACEQNTFSVKYMCYVGDAGTVDNSVTATNYHVRSVTFPDCRMDPADFDGWMFSADNNVYAANALLSPWTYGNSQNFVPAYNATFNCNTDHWMAPSGGNPTTQTIKLGGNLTMPAMNCVPRPEYEGWVNTNSQWNSAYDHDMITPVSGATCDTGDFTVNGGATFNWQCPTHLTFTPDDELITKTITVSCGTGGTTGQIPINYGDDVSALVGQWLATNCTGSCQNPSGPSHGYWKFCGVWENGAVPNVTPIDGEPGCYRAQTPYDLDQIEWENVTSFNITTVAYCPKYVKYKCSDDATTSYTDSTYSYFEEPYTVLDHVTTLCTDFGYEFDNWKVEGENTYYDENETVAEWPYETEVTLVAQWGDANTYDIIYHYDSTASWDTGNHPDTYTVNDLPLTINGVMTRQNSIFIGWCDDQALTQNCGTPRVIPAGTTGTVHFWAKWDCVEPYHIGPETGLCEACPDGQYWDGTQCVGCSAAFPNSTAPFNWSEAQCWRNCPNNAACQLNSGLSFDNTCSIVPIDSTATIQIEFKGNADADITTCDATNVPYCPYGLDCSAESVNMPRSVPAKFWYGADLSNNTTRYVIGLGRWGANPQMTNGRMWSAIMGPAQQMSFSTPNDAYTFITYPVQYAPDADVPGMTFTGYFDQQNGGTQYVADTRLLNSTNANTVATILDSQIPGDRNLYAHYDANDYTVTYRCGAGTGADTTDTATYGTDYTVLNLGQTNCSYTGHTFLGWVFSGDSNTYDGGETFNWTYSSAQTFTAKWSGVNTYNIYYENMNNATPSATGMPTSYTYGIGATITGVPTRPRSEFLGWCTDADLTDCAMTHTISTTDTGDKTFWAKWECMSPYHLDPNDPSQCVACPDNTWWNPEAQTCDRCSAEFPFSRSPYTWSEKQCYRPCQDGVQCNANVGTMLSGFPSSCQIELFPSGITTQIEFKGNYEDGIQTCDGAVPNCPYGFTACGAGAAYKPMVAPVEFHGKIPETDLGTRYIFGSRAGSGSIDLARGDAWSQIAGSGQKTNIIHNNVGGVIVDYQYTHIFYPTDAAPDATVPGYTFNGYYYPRSSGTRYVESNYLLNAANALAVLQSQSGDSNTARHLYATLENGYTQIDYTITYNCGTATGGTAPASQTGIHYGYSVTPQANTCAKPGYTFQGWMVSNTTDIQQPGVAFTWQYEENKTFTAKWSDEPIDYTITYNCGTGNPPAPESQNGIHYGDSVTPQANTCTKPGYNFQGWTVSNTADIQQPGVAFTWQYEEDKVFTAKWSDDPNTYVITYTPGYTGSGQSNVTQNITFGGQFQTQGRVFTRAGHIMTGWSEPFPLLSHDYTYNIEGNTSLDAQWQICPNGQTPNEDGTECEPCPEGEAGVGGICNPCPAGQTPNANQTECVPCPDGQYSVNGVCVPCPAGQTPNADGNGCEPCPAGQYSVNGVCMPCPAGQIPNANGDGCEPCPDGQYPVNGVCVPCPAGTYGTNGTCEPCPDGSSSNPGATSIDQCFITECPTGQHIDHGACYDDVMECTAPHASYATRTWNPSLAAYGSCIIQECIDGYHIASNACVLDEQFCAVPNGRGEREWTGTQWGECIVTQCDPGFENTGTACRECDNRRVNGEIAASSYASGCEIATCMYHGQKYILENNECRAICEKPDDHTGSMRWDDTTKKCVRTCNPGYKMW